MANRRALCAPAPIKHIGQAVFACPRSTACLFHRFAAPLEPRLAFCLWSATLLPAFAQPKDSVAHGRARLPTARCASTADTTPSGLVVVVAKSGAKDESRVLQAMKNPFMNGVGVQINWSDIEPGEGKPDWSDLDALFAAAESSKKWVKLDIFAGFFSPAWALEGAETGVVNIPYGPVHGTEAKLPMPRSFATQLPVFRASWPRKNGPGTVALNCSSGRDRCRHEPIFRSRGENHVNTLRIPDSSLLPVRLRAHLASCGGIVRSHAARESRGDFQRSTRPGIPQERYERL